MIQPTNEGYKLTEIYEVKNRSFTLNFGQWSKNFGLEVSNISFYQRRFNLQNVEIGILTSQDIEVSNGFSVP